MNNLKSESWIVIELLLILLALGGLSCFFVPAYEKGFWYITGAMGGALSVVLGYKFGRSMPQQATDAKPGQTSQTSSQVTTIPEPPPTVSSPSPASMYPPLT
jgi:hypothetical protein